eukprot:1052108-Pelagomonas_calceolata.AAC.1
MVLFRPLCFHAHGACVAAWCFLDHGVFSSLVLVLSPGAFLCPLCFHAPGACTAAWISCGLTLECIPGSSAISRAVIPPGVSSL